MDQLEPMHCNEPNHTVHNLRQARKVLRHLINCRKPTPVPSFMQVAILASVLPILLSIQTSNDPAGEPFTRVH